ncbi:MAG: bifunctional glutamate N-acetyltransferase/amino-acid acetyltransferase ArgJ [Sphingomonadaceae bacterium]|nr:bifunctional glutamate N-acetyltransferase/amino-acid acetyltransferase ArgJ [Sphingomonadaceae bacterium]
MAISPLAPAAFPALPEIGGVERRVVCARYKDWARADLSFVTLSPGTQVAGVTTRNVCCSHEVEICREGISGGRARALIVNAGNSNAFTGWRGAQTVSILQGESAAHLDCPVSEIFVSSTGVIGVPLPEDRARAGLHAAFAADPCSWQQLAEAITTTDTFPKGATASAVVGTKTVHISGIAKGSGMIAPDMATMLAYIFTDAAVDAPLLQQMIATANATSFNAITVDGDTSTSDTLLIFATGTAGNAPLSSIDDPGADALYAAIHDVCRQLAHQIVRDGEGAQKFIAISVTGAVHDASAHRVAMAIANSPLVKTAIAGGDANWGRVVMAVGKAGEPADRDRLSIRFGDVMVARDGLPVDGYDEAPVSAHLAGQDVDVAVDLGLGSGRAQVWTCDLTHGYIEINADYRS